MNGMNEKKLQETIMDLQARLAFQEDSLDTINMTVVRQQSKIDLLQREILRLKEILEDLRGTQGDTDGGIELPPHY
jgi:SlyX protein